MVEGLPLIAPDWALFLDVDGTLLDYVPQPEAARVPVALRETLATLWALLDGALAVVSGRAIADLDRLFGPLRLPVAGQHGAEIRCGARTESVVPASPKLAAILATADAFAAREPAIHIERKGLSAAIHYRGAEAVREALGAALAATVEQGGHAFNLICSHLAFDVVPQAANKGHAIERFMTVAPFAARIPVFIGDDRTDEDGFAAVIARGGHAIKIGDRGETIAPWHIANPTELRQWLERSTAALERCA